MIDKINTGCFSICLENWWISNCRITWSIPTNRWFVLPNLICLAPIFNYLTGSHNKSGLFCNSKNIFVYAQRTQLTWFDLDLERSNVLLLFYWCACLFNFCFQVHFILLLCQGGGWEKGEVQWAEIKFLCNSTINAVKLFKFFTYNITRGKLTIKALSN